MGKYIKNFSSVSDANTQGAAGLYSPHVSIVEGKPAINYAKTSTEKFTCSFNENGKAGNITPVTQGHAVGDIAYWDGSKIAFSPYTAWTSSLGTPLAACVIPTSHNVYGNGKAGFVSVKGVDYDGSQLNLEVDMVWGGDTGLTKYTVVPTWTNDSGSSYGTSSSGYLPSDSSTFTGDTCFCDSQARYCQTGITNMIPSCYLNDGSQNTAYSQTLTDGNALSDFAGAANTAVLSAKGSKYTAAYACSLFSMTGIPAGNWYLPAAGELAYIVPRIGVINAALRACGGVVLAGPIIWSSSECNDNTAYEVDMSKGYVIPEFKFTRIIVRVFVTLD